MRALLGLGMLVANNPSSQLQLASHANIKDLLVGTKRLFFSRRSHAFCSLCKCSHQGGQSIGQLFTHASPVVLVSTWLSRIQTSCGCHVGSSLGLVERLDCKAVDPQCILEFAHHTIQYNAHRTRDKTCVRLLAQYCVSRDKTFVRLLAEHCV